MIILFKIKLKLLNNYWMKMNIIFKINLVLSLSQQFYKGYKKTNSEAIFIQ